jgi:hypothetical protein
MFLFTLRDVLLLSLPLLLPMPLPPSPPLLPPCIFLSSTAPLSLHLTCSLLSPSSPFLPPAMRRRFQKRVYIALPEASARTHMLKLNLGKYCFLLFLCISFFLVPFYSPSANLPSFLSLTFTINSSHSSYLSYSLTSLLYSTSYFLLH